MESAALKRTIGEIYFLVFLIIIIGIKLFYTKIIDSSLNRLIICCSFAFLGLSIRAWFYYGKWKKDEKKELSKEQVKDCIFSYIFYGIIAIALSSFIYLMFYENLKNMDFSLFFFISIFLFTYFGFAIDKAIKFLTK